MERGRVEKSLLDNRQRLEHSLRGAELALWDVDIQTDTVSIDQTWADIFGLPLDADQPSVTFWQSLIHPHDRLRVLKVWNEHLEGSRERFEAEHRIRNKFGEWKWLLARGKAVERTAEGKPLRVSGVALDVTGRRCAEELLLQSKVFADATDPICHHGSGRQAD